VTLQCAQQLQAHMQLDTAKQVVEVTAGAGLGSLDIAQRMVPTMVELVKETLKNVGSDHLEVRVQEANGTRMTHC
jgi:hypothetical protein